MFWSVDGVASIEVNEDKPQEGSRDNDIGKIG